MNPREITSKSWSLLPLAGLVLYFGCDTVKPKTSQRSDLLMSSDALVDVTDPDSEQVTEGGDEGDIEEPAKPLDVEPTLDPAEFSLAVFQETLYPHLAQYCGGCHGQTVAPFFASPDPAEAHQTVLDNQKVNFDSPERSRLVVKLRDLEHNCWSGDCEADAQVLLGAITDWKSKLEEVGSAPDLNKVNTDELAFAMAQEKEPEQDPGTIVFLATDYIDLTVPLQVANDDPDLDVLSYVLSPENNGQNLGANAQGGEARYTFDVAFAGDYAVWGRVKAEDGTDNSFHISMDSGTIFQWGTAVTGDMWAWDRSNQNNGMEPLVFNLTQGSHTLMIKMREDFTKFNRLAVTDQLETFSGAEIDGTISELRFDLADLTGKAASLLVDVKEFDEGSKTILIKNLRIETQESIRIKDVMPLINGQWNPQHATYRLVDTTVAAPGDVLSEYSLVLIGEGGFSVDALSFTFGEIQ
jgi:hypothetical protein